MPVLTKKNTASKKKKAAAPAKKKAAASPNGKRALSKPTAERAVDEALVQRTLARISKQDNADAAERRAIGERILVDYFGRDEELARSRSPVKPKSFARLTERVEDETSWDERDLWRAVASAIVYRSLSSSVRDQLPPSYLYQLASIDDLAVRATIAAKIARGDLRGRAAQTAIADAGGAERGGGKKAQAAPTRGLASLERAVRRIEEDEAFDKDQLRDLDAAEREDLERRARALLAKLRDLLGALSD